MRLQSCRSNHCGVYPHLKYLFIEFSGVASSSGAHSEHWTLLLRSFTSDVAAAAVAIFTCQGLGPKSPSSKALRSHTKVVTTTQTRLPSNGEPWRNGSRIPKYQGSHDAVWKPRRTQGNIPLQSINVLQEPCTSTPCPRHEPGVMRDKALVLRLIGSSSFHGQSAS